MRQKLGDEDDDDVVEVNDVDDVDDVGDGNRDEDDDDGDDDVIKPEGRRSEGTRQKEYDKEQAGVLLHPEIPEESFRVLTKMKNGTAWICS